MHNDRITTEGGRLAKPLRGSSTQATSSAGSAWQDDLLTNPSWFWCWYRMGGVTWNWTPGDRYGNWGGVHQNYLYTSSAFDANPGAYGMRYCY